MGRYSPGPESAATSLDALSINREEYESRHLELIARVAVLEAQYTDLKATVEKVDGKIWGVLITNLITLGAVVAVLAKL